MIVLPIALGPMPDARALCREVSLENDNTIMVRLQMLYWNR